jgi:ABC-type uncharacterized transport system substrate-binding protein
VKAVEVATPLLAIETVAAPAREPSELESVIRDRASAPHPGLLVLPDVFTSTNSRAIVGLAARYSIPAVYPFKFFARYGGLLSYGVEASEPFREAAKYVDRILRGAKISELPVQAPTKWELVLNLKAAKELGLEVPPTLLARADEVIE